LVEAIKTDVWKGVQDLMEQAVGISSSRDSPIAVGRRKKPVKGTNRQKMRLAWHLVPGLNGCLVVGNFGGTAITTLCLFS
jgi:hypothetical protein